MKTIQFYSSFSHTFSVNGDEIHYYESRFIKSNNHKVLCIDSADTNVKIGEILEPEHRIELWAKDTFKERIAQDIKLGMKKQVVHYCDNTSSVVNLK
jgi:hypothetical protein